MRFKIIHPNRWFIWTLVFLLAAALFLMFAIQMSLLEIQERLGETFAPASLSTADPSYFGWKYLRSDALGISVKYPPSWQVEIEPQGKGTLSLQNPDNYNENISLARTLLKLEPVIRASLKTASEKDILVDGLPGKWLAGADKRDRVLSQIILVHRGGGLYYFAGSGRALEKVIKGIRFLP